MRKRKKTKGRKANSYKGERSQLLIRNTEQTTLSRRFWPRIKSALFLLSAVAGIIGIIYNLWPRPQVMKGDLIDPSNPFSASFTIINSSVIPLRDVTVAVGVGQIVPATKEMDRTFVPTFESEIVRSGWDRHSLGIDEKFTIALEDAFRPSPDARFSGADIAIIVNYKPWFLPLAGKKIFRFVTRRESDGHLYWFSVPLTFRGIP